jgi:two-component sensor histidine kinase
MNNNEINQIKHDIHNACVSIQSIALLMEKGFSDKEMIQDLKERSEKMRSLISHLMVKIEGVEL